MVSEFSRDQCWRRSSGTRRRDLPLIEAPNNAAAPMLSTCASPSVDGVTRLLRADTGPRHAGEMLPAAPHRDLLLWSLDERLRLGRARYRGVPERGQGGIRCGLPPAHRACTATTLPHRDGLWPARRAGGGRPVGMPRRVPAPTNRRAGCPRAHRVCWQLVGARCAPLGNRCARSGHPGRPYPAFCPTMPGPSGRGTPGAGPARSPQPGRTPRSPWLDDGPVRLRATIVRSAPLSRCPTAAVLFPSPAVGHRRRFAGTSAATAGDGLALACLRWWTTCPGYCCGSACSPDERPARRSP